MDEVVIEERKRKTFIIRMCTPRAACNYVTMDPILLPATCRYVRPAGSIFSFNYVIIGSIRKYRSYVSHYHEFFLKWKKETTRKVHDVYMPPNLREASQFKVYEEDMICYFILGVTKSPKH